MNRFHKIILLGLCCSSAICLGNTSTNDLSITQPNLSQLIPTEKNLDPAWIKSLADRGKPQVCSGMDLSHIGMPIGGLFSGQLYLGGDGQLWNWDIFNDKVWTGDDHYAHPMEPMKFMPLEQHFALKIGDRSISLDTNGFSDVSFRGEYPIGTVLYRDSSVPVSVKLEAFSPFIPLDVEDSSLPATILRYTLTNTSSNPVQATLSGSLENAVLLRNRNIPGTRTIATLHEKDFCFLECTVKQGSPTSPPTNPRKDILIEDWSKATYDGWKVEGTAFGKGPILKSQLPQYQGNVGGDTLRVVNSHATAPGKNVAEKDKATGKLTGKTFLIERNYLVLWIGGGNKPGKIGVNVLVDGKVVASATGKDKNQMEQLSLNLRKFQGQKGVLEIIDDASFSWGNIGVGRILLSDKKDGDLPFEKLPDNGSMGLALFGDTADRATESKSVPIQQNLVGSLGRTIKLAPGESATVTFANTWFFPNFNQLTRLSESGQWYSSKFDSALSGCAIHLSQ